jgi:hypothetical protein
MTSIEDTDFGTVPNDSFDLRQIKPKEEIMSGDAPYADALEVIEELFSDNRRVGNRKPYQL